ncbi:protein of unknown function [Rhodovastum atsumiense]|nr:protein of unknown function [Rhodovastum atsumiense]
MILRAQRRRMRMIISNCFNNIAFGFINVYFHYCSRDCNVETWLFNKVFINFLGFHANFRRKHWHP